MFLVIKMVTEGQQATMATSIAKMIRVNGVECKTPICLPVEIKRPTSTIDVGLLNDIPLSTTVNGSIGHHLK